MERIADKIVKLRDVARDQNFVDKLRREERYHQIRDGNHNRTEGDNQNRALEFSQAREDEFYHCNSLSSAESISS